MKYYYVKIPLGGNWSVAIEEVLAFKSKKDFELYQYGFGYHEMSDVTKTIDCYMKNKKRIECFTFIERLKFCLFGIKYLEKLSK